MTLGDLVRERAIVVCTGTGGVGKTTTAAALALGAAREGRRAVVVTIDPARRLADTLGIGSLSNVATRIDGDWPGELWALMLDTESTFDALVSTYAADDEQATRIVANRFYRNIAGALSGTQEYMAGEKLYELHESGAFDVVVVDTPPTRRALDFLDASRRLSRFLDHRLYRTLVAPTRGYLRAVNMAAQGFLRTAGKLVGTEVIDDALAFFAAFDGMEEGFRQRSAKVQALLADGVTAYVLVASPRADTVAEASYFADRLRANGITVGALVVNRLHPRFGDASSAQARASARSAGGDLACLYDNLADLSAVAEGEEAHLAGLLPDVDDAPVVRVPLLEREVHDLSALAEVADHLLAH
ncbi:MAG: ArsA family ATPase [Acidobacteria bacterium]|nr:ArsA family ATPase [Acidobacteriota bacterium]